MVRAKKTQSNPVSDVQTINPVEEPDISEEYQNSSEATELDTSSGQEMETNSAADEEFTYVTVPRLGSDSAEEWKPEKFVTVADPQR